MKKFLVIDGRPGGDWSLDLLFAGLVRRFGPSGVVDYPAQLKHRAGVPVFTGDPETDWGAERRSLCHTSDNHLILPRALGEIQQMLKCDEIECIFVDERDESYEFYLEL